MLRGALAVGLVLLIGSRAGAQDAGDALPEYVVKAGFLYNFAKYVEWPAAAFEKPDSPIAIGIVGADPFGGELDKVLKGKTARNRSFTVVRFADAESIGKCQILFVPRTEKERLADILKKVRELPVLTVGEDGAFARQGGATTILIDKEKPRLEMNPEAAEKAGLTIDAKLLRVATIVKSEN